MPPSAKSRRGKLFADMWTWSAPARVTTDVTPPVERPKLAG
jgi:hypothetical protein